MKYIKTFEEIVSSFNRNNRPKEGNYVIIKCRERFGRECNNGSSNYPEFERFINTNIGKIIDTESIFIRVNYKNIPNNILDKFSSYGNFQMDKNNPLYYYSFQYSDVIAYSDNEKELETLIKYNL